jgi:hypothetical protein
MSQVLKFILIFVGLGIVFAAVYLLLLFFSVGAFDKDYSVSDLIIAFNKNKKNIYELKHYFNRIVPKNKFVEIEFENNSTLARFGIGSTGEHTQTDYLEWHVPVNSKRTDSVLSTIGWDRQTLKKIKSMLDDADCIKVQSGEPSEIGFKRCGMGMYSFLVFDCPIADSNISEYNDSCMDIYVNRYLVLSYGGGAIGPQCFYNKK